MITSDVAGGIVLNTLGEVALVTNPGGWWGFPKGHIDAGEDAVAAAKREIAEEAGIPDVKLVRPLGTYVRYKTAPSGKEEDRSEWKHIEMFFFTTETTAPLKPQDSGNPEAKWFPVHEVSSVLSNLKDKEFFLSVSDLIQLPKAE